MQSTLGYPLHQELAFQHQGSWAGNIASYALSVDETSHSHGYNPPIDLGRYMPVSRQPNAQYSTLNQAYDYGLNAASTFTGQGLHRDRSNNIERSTYSPHETMSPPARNSALQPPNRRQLSSANLTRLNQRIQPVANTQQWMDEAEISRPYDLVGHIRRDGDVYRAEPQVSDEYKTYEEETQVYDQSSSVQGNQSRVEEGYSVSSYLAYDTYASP